MKIKATARTTTERTIEGEISAEELLSMLGRSIHLPSGSVVTFYMDVPGGGDWSNTELRIDGKNPLRFRAVSLEEHVADEPLAPTTPGYPGLPGRP